MSNPKVELGLQLLGKHYGGPDGKQDHKNGSPQTIHDKGGKKKYGSGRISRRDSDDDDKGFLNRHGFENDDQLSDSEKVALTGAGVALVAFFGARSAGKTLEDWYGADEGVRSQLKLLKGEVHNFGDLKRVIGEWGESIGGRNLHRRQVAGYEQRLFRDNIGSKQGQRTLRDHYMETLVRSPQEKGANFLRQRIFEVSKLPHEMQNDVARLTTAFATKSQYRGPKEIIDKMHDLHNVKLGSGLRIRTVFAHLDEDTVLGATKGAKGKGRGKVMGLIFDGRRPVGFISMSPDFGKKVATYDMAYVPPKYRAGIFDDIQKSLYPRYKDAGFERVETFANLDVGGYLWAKSGWRFSRHKDMPEDTMNALEDMADGGKWVNPDTKEVVDISAFGRGQAKTRRQISDIIDRFNDAEGPEDLDVMPVEVAAIGYHQRELWNVKGMKKPVEMWPGKQLLMNLKWDAEFDFALDEFVDPAVMRSTFFKAAPNAAQYAGAYWQDVDPATGDFLPGHVDHFGQYNLGFYKVTPDHDIDRRFYTTLNEMLKEKYPSWNLPDDDGPTKADLGKALLASWRH